MSVLQQRIRQGIAGCVLVLPLFALANNLGDPGADPLAWLKRAQTAASDLGYAGAFVHTSSERSMTSRIIHFRENGQEYERIESLDGPLREFVRKGNEMYCYMPDAKTVRIDRKLSGRFFPHLISGVPEAVAEQYDVMLGGLERVAGHDCRWIHLNPKDAWRYPQRLCSEVSSGLLLRAQLLNDRQQMLEQFTFTEVKIGARLVRAYNAAALTAGKGNWKQEQTLADVARPVDTGFALTEVPGGFRKTAEVRRAMPGRPNLVDQIVLSDGLASLSIFIEPLPAGKQVRETASEAGCSSVYTNTIGNRMITVLGEVPVGTAQQVGRNLKLSNRP